MEAGSFVTGVHGNMIPRIGQYSRKTVPISNDGSSKFPGLIYGTSLSHLDAESTCCAFSKIQRPSVGCDYLTHNRQTKPCSICSRRLPRFECVRPLGLWDPITGISHVQSNPVVDYTNVDRHVRTTVFDSVPEEVLEELLETVRISLDSHIGINDEFSRRCVDHSPPFRRNAGYRNRGRSSIGCPCRASASRSSINDSIRSAPAIAVSRCGSSYVSVATRCEPWRR